MNLSLAQVLWQSPDLAPVAVAMLAVLIAAVVWLYPPQTRAVPTAWRWVLPMLRALAIAALAVAVVQPVVLRPRTAEREGAVVVLVDRSHSMSIVDRDRPPAEQVALAAGLGALPDGARTEAAPGLRAKLDNLRSLADQLSRARSEADYARLSSRGVASTSARVRDATERLREAMIDLPDLQQPADLATKVAALKKVPPALDDPVLRTIRASIDPAEKALADSQAQADEQLFKANARVQSICASLTGQSREKLVALGLTRPGGLLASLPAGTPVYGFAFAEDLDILPKLSGGNVTKLDLDPFGIRTDLSGAIRDTLNRVNSRAVQAIVMLSDGRQVGTDAEAGASDLSTAGVPVFSVMTAPPGQGRDLSIVSIDAPASARVGQTVLVRVTIRGPGFRGAGVDVRLNAENMRQIRRVTIGNDLTATAEFDVVLARPGAFSLEVNIQPMPGELSEENNQYERWIKVGAEPARVLVLAGADAGRQYASLHAALSRAPWVALREAEQGDAANVSPRAILDQDVVVLCDLSPDILSDAQWTAIEQLMRQRGGSVIVCAGRHAPAEYAAHRRASRLLPFDPASPPAWRTWPGGEPHFRVLPSAALESGAIGGEMEFWRQLGPVSRFVPLSPLVGDARAMLVERDSGAAVMTEARRGAGRVFFIGTDQTWRWRGQTGGEEAERFWPQLVRVAAGEPYAAAEGNLRLDAEQIAPEPDESFTVRARIMDSYGQPVEAPTQTLHIARGSEAIREVTMSPSADGSGQYEATVSGLAVGDYVLRVDAPEDASQEVPPDPVQLAISVSPRFEAEMADLSGDDRLLRRMADASGGQFLTLDQFNLLPGRLADNRHKQSRLVEYTLWDSPYLFGFVLACLSMEWALRKKLGMA